MARRKYTGRPFAAIAIFLIIIVYIVCFLILFVSKKKIQVYEVTTGNVGKTLSGTGVILRDESVYNVADTGNISYYQREGTRVKVETPIYTIDKTGKLDQLIKEYASNEGGLTSEEKREIRSLLTLYKSNYKNAGFRSIYDVSANINSIIVSSITSKLQANKEAIEKETGVANALTTVNAEKPGYIVYSIDGYEGLTEDTIDEKVLNKSAYSKKNLPRSGEAAAGSPAYRLVNNENWYIYIPLTEDKIKANDLRGTDVVSIRLVKANVKITGNFAIIEKNNNLMGRITVNRYLLNYLNERYADVEITISQNTGLKIPNSAIVSRDLYKIPDEYLTTGGNSIDPGFIVKNGNKTEFRPVSIAYRKDGYCYIKTDNIARGTLLYKPDSSEAFTIGATEKIDGVYCINTGYTVFYPITIISINEEYAVAKETIGGLSIYDRILLNASGYKENNVVY